MLHHLRRNGRLHPYNLTREAITRFKHDSLFRNSVFLMLSTAIMSVFGFIFWIIAARFYTPGQIGFATALISVTSLLSNLSLLGFNTAIVRYLPKHKNASDTINTAIVFTMAATVLISIAYLLGIHQFAPAFQQLTSNLGYGVLFVIFMMMVSLNTLTDSVFIAFRASQYNAIVYFFFGVVKIILPLLLVAMGAYGIFFAYTGSVIVALAMSLFFMYRKFDYRFRWTVKKKIALQMGKFAGVNYASSLVASVPILMMPSLLVSKLGAEQAAYYYLASTIAAILYIIPMATTEALLAEGSHDEKGIGAFVRGAAKLIAILMLPAILLLVVGGHFVLAIFGEEYAHSSEGVLDILALMGIVMSVNMVFGTIMRIRHQLKELLIINIAYFVFTMALALTQLHRGVLWAGWVLLLGQIFSCVLNVLFYRLYRHKGGHDVLGSNLPVDSRVAGGIN